MDEKVFTRRVTHACRALTAQLHRPFIQLLLCVCRRTRWPLLTAVLALVLQHTYLQGDRHAACCNDAGSDVFSHADLGLTAVGRLCHTRPLGKPMAYPLSLGATVGWAQAEAAQPLSSSFTSGPQCCRSLPEPGPGWWQRGPCRRAQWHSVCKRYRCTCFTCCSCLSGPMESAAVFATLRSYCTTMRSRPHTVHCSVTRALRALAAPTFAVLAVAETAARRCLTKCMAALPLRLDLPAMCVDAEATRLQAPSAKQPHCEAVPEGNK